MSQRVLRVGMLGCGTVGAAVRTPRPARTFVAIMAYVSQRMPARNCSGIPMRVWKTCDLRLVRRTVRTGAACCSSPSPVLAASAASAPSRGCA